MLKFSKYFSKQQTSQREDIAGVAQVENSAGGFAWEVDSSTRLDRFLILGSQGGTYYVAPRKLTVDAIAVADLLATSGSAVVDRVLAVSNSGRAPKNDAPIFALAMAAKLGDDTTRCAAFQAMPKVCRTGTHLMQFVDSAQSLGGWGRGMRRAVASWFNDRPASELAYQLIKYRSRNGWSIRDLLRLTHPRAASPIHDQLLRT
jgi:60 kDa SS-A/Ro ribonucleoprotein